MDKIKIGKVGGNIKLSKTAYADLCKKLNACIGEACESYLFDTSDFVEVEVILHHKNGKVTNTEINNIELQKD